MEQQTSLQKNIGIFFGVMVACGVLFVTVFFGNQSSSVTPPTIQTAVDTPKITPTQTSVNNTSSNTTTTPKTTPKGAITQTPPVVDTPKKTSSVYTNGTYSATGSYISPGGYQQLGVSVALQNDIITSASVTNMASDGRSQRYQNMFISGYQQYVIGKNIADVYLTKVSGSSLTSSGFNDALTQIKAKAKA